MKPTPEQVADDLRVHLEDCASFRDRIEKKLAEAETERRDMAADIKQLLGAMNHGRGFMRALAVMGTIGIAFAGGMAWGWDHLRGLLK